MEYDRADSFPFDLEPNGIQLASKLQWKMSMQSYSNQFKRKQNYI